MRGLGRQCHSARPSTRLSLNIPTDHNPILTSLSLPQSAFPPDEVSDLGDKRPPRTQFHSSRLKDSVTLDSFRNSLESKSQKLLSVLRILRQDAERGGITAQEYADEAQSLITQALHEVGDEILQRVPPTTSNRSHIGQPTPRDQVITHHSSSNGTIRNLQRQSQTALNALRSAKCTGAPPADIARLAAAHLTLKNQVIRGKHHIRQSQLVHDSILSSDIRDSQPRNIWKLLRKYKMGNTKSTLPTKILDNASGDPRKWLPGQPTDDPYAWHRYRHALGHHLFRHSSSPFDERAALRIHERMPRIISSIYRPISPPDPLFEDTITSDEVSLALKDLNPDKAPGEDGITNRMLQSGGKEFNTVMYEFLRGLWDLEVQPTPWNLSLLSPLYKGGKKKRADPSSYRGIYLCSAFSKLFEGLLLSRLTQFTERKNTLTQNQLGTRPSRQAHDAIYCLLSNIQFNQIHVKKPTYVAFLDYTTAFPSVHRERLLHILP